MRALPVWPLVALCLSCASRSQVAAREAPPAAPFDEARAVHVLQRLAYGPSARDLAEVKRLGVDGWVEAQLQPAPKAALPPGLEAKLQAFPTLGMSMQQLVEDYPRPPQEMPREEKRERGPSRVVFERSSARVLRAVESPRQLEEVLVDFWFNHFNVSEDKGVVKWMATAYERDAIRPHVFGTFRELLGATAHHPAMLFYLDNWRSTREGLSQEELRHPKRFRRQQAAAPAPMMDDGAEDEEAKPKLGLNENYARELLELHTLGVDGGYTQDDVREVARCFTGWTVRKPRKEPDFLFRPVAHDAEAKVVLGQAIPSGGGEKDGERVLDLLANHPSTARHVALKLARRFVADAPPPELVDRVAEVFLESKGDLRKVYRALFQSPEFQSPQTYAAKVKTPFEYVVSALRATDAQVEVTPRLLRHLALMGEPLYRAPAPTGFPEVAGPWVNSGALVARLNFGLDLVGGRLPGARVSWDAFAPKQAPSAVEWVDGLGRALLGAKPSEETRATILAALAEKREAASAVDEAPPVDVALIAGLLLGSPEFQKQ
ncbi:DUF1800 domain-containing protein [Corallococcus terminator]|uniref:DUF1800 domain-containing protein n=1 Tax=Corallococcus terminator TaxID=2316733 RepID=A0A3A8IRG2_9BACT|nr:DUF1800 domain-containing protein [Corallococcus terminator]RKG85872.1 DUF1800 domain-containing protein [Corallococcus terminator]